VDEAAPEAEDAWVLPFPQELIRHHQQPNVCLPKPGLKCSDCGRR
jgi:hypothetical protein